MFNQMIYKDILTEEKLALYCIKRKFQETAIEYEKYGF